MCVGGDWAGEKLSGRVQLEGHSPRWRVLLNFSFQPCLAFFINVVIESWLFFNRLCDRNCVEFDNVNLLYYEVNLDNM